MRSDDATTRRKCESCRKKRREIKILREQLATARKNALRDVKGRVELLPRHSVVDAGGDEYDNGSFDMWKCGEVLAMLDAARGA